MAAQPDMPEPNQSPADPNNTRGHRAFDTLFVFGRGPELFENVTIHMKLAQLERSKRGKEVEIMLMHDAAWWAQKGKVMLHKTWL